ncbi:hypothetical protein FD01_GL002040 [Lacticaseibacillus manihotivorans DSM 13343 = JCM 12514]|uniref:Uncharacterized protein n=1 Tax=Lacticaseibacillus manihotivorans DSM 13343 = JCM 12514 TaxID=1423769 RepID=A0A0R1QBJ4_9LACO|nr:hypothetical protein FD01_GL002040 [Lacticaseibacillus manihotivorans DSM 13343 = JCM 12514]
MLDATRRAQHMPAPILYDDIVDQPTFEAFINGTQFPTPQQIMAFTARLKQNEAPLVFTHTDPISKNRLVNQTIARLLKAGDWVGANEFLQTLASDSRAASQNQAYALYRAISVYLTGDATAARALLENSLTQSATSLNLKYLSQATLAYIAANSGRKFVATRYRHYLLQTLQKPARELDVGAVYLLLALADVVFDQTAPALQLIQTGISIATASHQSVVAWRLIDLWAQLLLPDATSASAARRLGRYLNDSIVELSVKFKPLPRPSDQEIPSDKRVIQRQKNKPAVKPAVITDPIAHQEKIAQTMKLMAKVRAKTKPPVEE